GRLSVLMITHKFREVMGFCDEVSVLRHGRLTGEGRVGDLTPAAMAEMMMGNATIPAQAPRGAVPADAPSAPRLVLEGVTAENLAFRTFDRHPLTLARWFVNRRAVHARAQALIERYNVKPAVPAARIGTLSGGNIQRAVLARELGDHVEVLVAANPCFGLDFKAVAEIRSQLMQARNRGAAVLLVSEDLDEILELADRILVISGGRIAYETTSKEADRAVIGKY